MTSCNAGLAWAAIQNATIAKISYEVTTNDAASSVEEPCERAVKGARTQLSSARSLLKVCLVPLFLKFALYTQSESARPMF